jgi:hypothetical protein
MDYIKQIEEENEALKTKLNTIFEWKVVDKPYKVYLDGQHESGKNFFTVEQECYIHGYLFARVGKDFDGIGYRGECKGTSLYDNKLEPIKTILEQTYTFYFYIHARIP